MNDKFLKLMAAMSEKKQQSANPGVDSGLEAAREKERQLVIIDDKIAQLEQSEDPNALESLSFWKQKRSEITGN